MEDWGCRKFGKRLEKYEVESTKYEDESEELWVRIENREKNHNLRQKGRKTKKY